MKVARFSSIDGVAHGVVEGDSVKVLRGGLFDEFEYTGKEYPLADVQLLAPVEPGKLVCVGLNYRLHAEESGVPVPDEPMLFMCSPQAIVAQGDTIVLDNHSDRIDFEAEIAIVVGREGRNVRRNEAKDYIFG